jgi:hypothetical protein
MESIFYLLLIGIIIFISRYVAVNLNINSRFLYKIIIVCVSLLVFGLIALIA